MDDQKPLFDTGLSTQRVDKEGCCMQRENALSKVEKLRAEIDSLRNAPYDHPNVERWRLSVEALLMQYLGESHTITMRFRELGFRVSFAVEIFNINADRTATQQEHQAAFKQDIQSAEAILDAAVHVWADTEYTLGEPTRPGYHAPSPVTVQVNNNNQNQNAANSSSSATAVASVEFPRDEILAMIDGSVDIPGEMKEEAKDLVENLDGELRKKNPRWEKVSGYMKGALGLGKDVAIKIMVGVAAEYLKSGLMG